MRKYWLGPVCEEIREIHSRFASPEAATRRMILTALLAALAAILQSMGGVLPGIGYLISPLAAAPIVLATILSFGSGLAAYGLTILLLLLLQPSELFVFPFTSGWLALAIGGSFLSFKSRLGSMLIGSAALWAGIALLLYVLRYPVLGPGAPSAFRLHTAVLLFLFSLLYSWLWVEFGRWLIRKVGQALT